MRMILVVVAIAVAACGGPGRPDGADDLEACTPGEYWDQLGKDFCPSVCNGITNGTREAEPTEGGCHTECDGVICGPGTANGDGEYEVDGARGCCVALDGDLRWCACD